MLEVDQYIIMLAIARIILQAGILLQRGKTYTISSPAALNFVRREGRKIKHAGIGHHHLASRFAETGIETRKWHNIKLIS